MNEKIDIKPKFLSPFKRFCMTIGELPTSYVESMTYYEMILWFTKYLGDTVIPAINNNAEALREVQNLFIELQDYVNTYFDNLNIQTEIDNKLDDMAESGELVEIISAYLDSQAIISFDTLSDMVEALNLTNGSVCKTLGKSTLNDGLGSLYKVRTKEVSDVADGDYLVDLDVSNTLIAEKIINNQDKYVIIIGDSYANRENGWADRIKTMAGLDNAHCNINKISGTGFCNTVNSHNFITMLTENITIPAKLVTDIIVCGGYNDLSYSATNIDSAISSFVSTATSTYPNATIHVGMIGWASYHIDNYFDVITGLNTALISYKKACQYSRKVKYLNNVEYIMHDLDYIDSSYNHPNSNGQYALSVNIMQAWLSGSCNINTYAKNIKSTFTVTNEDVTSTSANTPNLYTYINNGSSHFFTNGDWYFYFDSTKNLDLSNPIEIGTIESFVMGRSAVVSASVPATIKTVNNGYFNVTLIVGIYGGTIRLYPKVLNRAGNGWLNEPVDYIFIQRFQIACDSMSQF